MAIKAKRVHILTTVNAANVSKSGGTYTIKDVCGAVDGIVMNGLLYPADQLAAGAPTLEGRPAPAGHPRDANGRAISALNGDALLSSFIGAICRNVRHEGGRTLYDVQVNEAQARAHPDGVKLVDRLDKAISGAQVDPIHVSTGLNLDVVAANGESRGKKYAGIATNLQYDHSAVLVNGEQGAGKPADGVGMFLNSDGSEQAIEHVELSPEPEDKRSAGFFKTWVRRLLGNAGTELSFDDISCGLASALQDGAWLQEVFDRYAIWRDRDGTMYQQDYTVSSDGSVAWSGTAQKVTRKVTYEPITNREDDHVKETIIAALNAAGISGVAAMTDAQLLGSFEALKAQPHIAALAAANEKLTAANSKIAGFEAERTAAQNAERDTLAAELAVNSALTVDDLKALPLARLKELKAKAAPVNVGGTGGTGTKSRYAGYSINEIAQGAKDGTKKEAA